MSAHDPMAMPAPHHDAAKVGAGLPTWLKMFLVGLIQKYGADALKALIDWLSKPEVQKTLPQA